MQSVLRTIGLALAAGGSSGASTAAVAAEISQRGAVPKASTAERAQGDYGTSPPTLLSQEAAAPPAQANLEPGAVVVRNGFLGAQEEYLGHAGIFWFYDARADKFRVLQASGFGNGPAGPRTWEGFLDRDAQGNLNSYVGSLLLPPGAGVQPDDLIERALHHVGAPYTITSLQSECGSDIACDAGNVLFQTNDCIDIPSTPFGICAALRCDGFVDLVYRDNNILIYSPSVVATPLAMYSQASSALHNAAVPPRAFGELIDQSSQEVRFSFSEWMSKYSLAVDHTYGPPSITAHGDVSGDLPMQIVSFEHPQRGGDELLDFLYWYNPLIEDDWYSDFDFGQYFSGAQWPCVYYPDGTTSLPSGAFKDDNRHDVAAVTVRVIGGVPGEEITVSINSTAKDLGGNPLQASIDGASIKFDVAGGGPNHDITDPTVQILDPVDGDEFEDVPNTVVRVSAVDNVAVNRVEFYANGVFLGEDLVPSGDGLSEYQSDWNLDAFSGQVLVQAIAYDTVGNSASDAVIVDVRRDGGACGIAQVSDWEFEEIGDGDGVIERGESADVRVPITAVGGFMNDVEATFNPSVGGFSDPDETDELGGFLDGQTKTAGPFRIDVPTLLPPTVEFTLTVRYNDGTRMCEDIFFTTRSFPAQGELSPAFSVCDTQIVEDDPSDAGQNDGNGTLENGEDAALRFSLQNTGDATAMNVRARPLGFSVAGLEVDTNFENFGDIAPGECLPTLTDEWDLDADRGLAPGTYTSDVEITYDGSPQPVVLTGALQVTVEPEAWLVVSPRSSDFGVVSPGETVSESFELVNEGAEPLTITGVVHSSPDTSLDRTTPFTIAAGSSEHVSVEIDTVALSGAIMRESQFETDARVRDPGEDDTALVTGSVSSSFPAYSVNNVSGAEDPDVGSGIIAWEDNRSGDIDVWAFDLLTGEEFPLVIADGDQFSPRIDGEWLAWSDSRGGTGSGSERTFDVRAMNLSTGNEILIAGTVQDERVVGISGDYVAMRRGYVDLLRDNGDFSRRAYDLVVYRMSDGSTIPITGFSHSGFADAPTIASDADFEDGFLVWEQYSHQYDNGNWQSITSSTLRRIVTSSDCAATDFTPDVIVPNYEGDNPTTSQCKVAWEQDGPDGCGDEQEQIFFWNAGSISQLTPNFACEDAEFRDPVVSGDLVTYEKQNRDLPGNPRFFAMRSISSGEETILSTSDPVDPWRMDGPVVAWRDLSSGSILFSYLGIADFGVTESGVQVPPLATEDAPIDVAVTVTNNTPVDTVEPAVVRLFNGNPDVSGVEVANAAIPPLSSISSIAVDLGAIRLEEGQQTLVFVVESVLDEYKGNNEAAVMVDVADDDTSPPVIAGIVISEQAGDGDGIIESGEGIRLSWSATDPKSIRSTSVVVDGVQRAGLPAGDSRFEAVYPPLNQGEYAFVITACDDDNSSSCATASGTFVVAAEGPACIADTNGDGVLSPADFNGWILAYNNRAPECDQNDDGACTPADFNGWILNFNAGCP